MESLNEIERMIAASIDQLQNFSSVHVDLLDMVEKVDSEFEATLTKQIISEWEEKPDQWESQCEVH